MSIQSALNFIHEIREGPERLRLSIQHFESTEDLDALVEFAKEEGYTFTRDEFLTAFKHDWAMRWFTQTGESVSDDNAFDRLK